MTILPLIEMYNKKNFPKVCKCAGFNQAILIEENQN